MTFAERQDQFAEWVQSVLGLHGFDVLSPGAKPEPGPRFWLLCLAQQAYYVLYSHTGGIRSKTVCYIFRRGSMPALPRILKGGDLGKPDEGQVIKVFNLENDWKYAAVAFSAVEAESDNFRDVVVGRIAEAVEMMK